MKTCSICKHVQRAAMEDALVQGLSNRAIACQFSVGRMAIQRHKEKCMPEEIAAAQAANKEAQGLDVLEQLSAANAVLLGIVDRATKVSIDAQAEGLSPAAARAEQRLQDMLILQAESRWHKQLELAAKLQGMLAQESTVQVNMGNRISMEDLQELDRRAREHVEVWRKERGLPTQEERNLLGDMTPAWAHPA